MLKKPYIDKKPNNLEVAKMTLGRSNEKLNNLEKAVLALDKKNHPLMIVNHTHMSGSSNNPSTHALLSLILKNAEFRDRIRAKASQLGTSETLVKATIEKVVKGQIKETEGEKESLKKNLAEFVEFLDLEKNSKRKKYLREKYSSRLPDKKTAQPE